MSKSHQSLQYKTVCYRNLFFTGTGWIKRFTESCPVLISAVLFATLGVILWRRKEKRKRSVVWILCSSEKQNQLCQVCTLKATLLGFCELCVRAWGGWSFFFFLRDLNSKSTYFVIPKVVLFYYFVKPAGCNKNNRQNKVRPEQSGEDL